MAVLTDISPKPKTRGRLPPLLIPALAILSVAFIAMAVSPMAYADDPAPQADIIDTDEVMDIIMGVIPILFLVGILYYIGTSLASGRVTGSSALAMVMAATVAVIVFVFLILPAIGGNRTRIQPPLGGLDLLERTPRAIPDGNRLFVATEKK